MVWRGSGAELEVLLVHRKRWHDWSWPKGKVDPGEELVATAVREVAEETGLSISLGFPLPSVVYKVPGGLRKVAHYWAADAEAEVPESVARSRGRIVPAGVEEIDRTRWLPAAQARDRLSYPADRRLLDLVVEADAAGTLRTSPLAVVRHAKAKGRSSWDGGEADRPLVAAGVEQARALVPVLSAYGITRVVSSPWERCASTIDPYLATTGITGEFADQLTEHAHTGSPASVAAIAADLLASDSPVAVCTHRPVLPTVLDVLSMHANRATASLLPRANPFLAPGEALIAHVATVHGHRRVVAVERQPGRPRRG